MDTNGHKFKARRRTSDVGKSLLAALPKIVSFVAFYTPSPSCVFVIIRGY